jgi:hypothetical protein
MPSGGQTGQGPADWFTGDVYVDTVRNPDDQSAIGCPRVPRADFRLPPVHEVPAFRFREPSRILTNLTSTTSSSRPLGRAVSWAVCSSL